MGNAGYFWDDASNDLRYDTTQQSWVVWSTWKHLFDALVDPPGEEVYFLQGVIDDDGNVSLLPLVQMQGIPDESSDEGYYQLQIQSSSGDVLYSTYFGQMGKIGLFNLLMPYTPGMGRLMIAAVTESDYPVAQAAFLLMAVIVILINLAVDLICFRLDPRLAHV